ncbi:dihydroneopterin aldolase [Jannaschia sp. M317]|uniref:dihydroneopterin aldolase n=1 Tax=Jannaschia sp. M317 TaxID=2867011 RepID=UPI0021A6D14F|nr:dihydroneopterin aldolase [Jannaschia sp. M317]UWQ17255.1 dihydroneopterin aldolase [Jannaschia sp. M317]
MAAEINDEDALAVAFSAPLDRARAGAGAHPRDRIALRDHIREVDIGAFQLERGTTQRIRFDIVCEVVTDTDAVVGDDVDGILSYDTLIDAISAELEAERVNLLETLAERIAARVLQHDQAARVFVRIEKLDRGPHVLGVEIVRSRTLTPAVSAPADAPPRPRVVHLGPGVLRHPGLTAMIDRVISGTAPVILTVSADFTPPEAGHPMAQRRVDLLALEQAAWQLAARDTRCVVVNSRTELDWALRQGNLSVWAPSRMVLDATDGPDGADAVTLVQWLAEEFDALELTLVGIDGPEGLRAVSELDAV